MSLIALEDLTQQARIIVAQTFLAFEIWFVIAAIYLIITVSLSFLVRYLEKRSPIVVWEKENLKMDIEKKKQPSKWITLRALRVLQAAYPEL